MLLALTSFPYAGKAIKPHNYIWDYYNNISTEFVLSKIAVLIVSIVLGLLPLFIQYFK